MAPQATSTDYLTRQGRAILLEILDWQAEHGYSPSIRELCYLLGLATPSTVHTHLTRLREQGFVTWVDGQTRTLVVTAAARAKLNVL